MVIVGVQFYPKFKKTEENLDYMKEKVKSVDGDLVAFPELATSGYFYLSSDEILPHSFEFHSEIVREFQGLATSMNRIILFGFPERFESKIYNSCAILFPDSELSCVYRKSHLFYREKFVFEPGNTGFFVVKYPEFDLNLGTMICYDWRFPESARVLALKGADLIVCPSNLVTKVWSISMPSRALENKIYLLVVNRVGEETNSNETLIFNGKSGIWHYNGQLITSASPDNEEIISAVISPSATRDKSFDDFDNVFTDRRPEFYKIIAEK
ncbi:MAG: carbon-nitrogen hydrolase [Ignavibacteria bacterium]|nr:carbon-nitrogen hydrolase [Ignavibacteria bacterium]